MLTPLILSANAAMWHAWHVDGLHRRKPNEVDCIKNLIQSALPIVQALWLPLLQQIGLQTTLRGVVCHGQPQVKFPAAPKACELGDLLLVHDHMPARAPLQRRAVIVQAKMFGSSGVTSKNGRQLHLYQKWPRFEYTKWPGGMSSLDSIHAAAGLTAPLPLRRERELSITGVPGGPPASSFMLDAGCRYGMIDEAYIHWQYGRMIRNPWRMCSAQVKNVYSYKAGFTFEIYLALLLAGLVGRHAPQTQWPVNLGVACHWSLMVMELLSIFPSSVVPGAIGSPSASDNVSFLAATPNLRLNTDRSVQSPPTGRDMEDEGVFGIIHIQTEGDLGDVT
jgi:hypothetical protein